MHRGLYSLNLITEKEFGKSIILRVLFLTSTSLLTGTMATGFSKERRTTLALAVRNEPGTLLAVLRVFAEHHLNMSKLESRPSRERAWEYVFWVDLDADTAEPATQAALDALGPVTTMVRVLGCYRKADEA